MTDDELIPCPLCGNISVVIESDGDLLYWGACHNNECDAIGPESHIRERAIKLWNTRPIEDALRAEIGRLMAKLEAAIDLAEEGISYTDEYFVQKWDMRERLEALKGIINV